MRDTQCHITKQLVHSFSVSISLPSMALVNITILRLTNPYVNLKRMNQYILLYEWKESLLLIGPICLHKFLCPSENWLTSSWDSYGR